MGAFIDLTGRNFGRLTVLKQAESSRRGKTRWTCRCECGTVKIVQSTDLRSGRTSSCGCLHREELANRRTTHGMSQNSRFYRIWAEMIRRCSNPNCRSFSDYGGRGITVDERWRTFENFRDDLYDEYMKHVAAYGERQTTIERKDVNSGYCPDNVCWITKSAQALNTRSTLYAKGVRETASGGWEAYFKRKGERFRKTFLTKEQALQWRKAAIEEYDAYAIP